MTALRNADAAGDKDAASRIAAMIKSKKPTQKSAENPDVPGGGQVSYAKPKELSSTDKLKGAGEATLTTATGATTGALGFGLGTLEGAVKYLMGDITQEEAMQIAQQRASDLTYEPKTEAGKEIVDDIGETLGVLPPVLGTAPVVGLNTASKIKLSKTKSPLAKRIAQESKGSIKKSFDKKLGDDRFTPRVFGMVKEARKQGFDDGMTTVIANANPIDKRRMRQQLSIMEKGRTDTKYQAANRPSDVAGNSMLKQIDFLMSNNKQAGQQLGRVARSLKGKDVDVDAPIAKFKSELEGIGVQFDQDGTVNFDNSRIRTIAPAKKVITDVLDEIRIRNLDDTDALTAHEFKGFLDENLSFGKKQEGLSGKAESITKSLRKGINESIGENYAAYKEANNRFSDTITVLDELQDVVGKKLNIKGPHADKAFGIALRTLLSNNKGRANMMTVVDNINSTARKYGGSFDDDILTQMLFSDELDSVFGSGARTSLRGEAKKAGVDTAIDVSQMSIPGAVAVGAKAGAKKLRGINEKNQLKALKKLLSAK